MWKFYCIWVTTPIVIDKENFGTHKRLLSPHGPESHLAPKFASPFPLAFAVTASFPGGSLQTGRLSHTLKGRSLPFL